MRVPCFSPPTHPIGSLARDASSDAKPRVSEVCEASDRFAVASQTPQEWKLKGFPRQVRKFVLAYAQGEALPSPPPLRQIKHLEEAAHLLLCPEVMFDYLHLKSQRRRELRKERCIANNYIHYLLQLFAHDRASTVEIDRKACAMVFRLCDAELLKDLFTQIAWVLCLPAHPMGDEALRCLPWQDTKFFFQMFTWENGMVMRNASQHPDRFAKLLKLGSAQQWARVKAALMQQTCEDIFRSLQRQGASCPIAKVNATHFAHVFQLEAGD